MLKKITVILLFLLFSISEAAVIKGSLYDSELEPLKDVIVKINTIPPQYYVSKDGNYSFEVPVGNYTIRADFYFLNESYYYAEENITVVDDGEYVIDLILLPNLEIEIEEFLNESDYSFEEEQEFNFLIILIPTGVILGIFILYFLKGRKKTPPLPEDLKKMVEIIKKEGGRTTQKELREKIGVSEAKISLMISDLEDRGIVKKIKKGRGNIIILKL